MIRFDHATKRYPDGTVAVDDLELEAPTGQITVLVGPSGCGKTTSLRMINRMIEPTDGTIWLDDTDTASMPAHELRRQIGYVIQHAGLFPHRTIVDNVATVPYLLGTDKKQARARAMELIERVGLDPAFAKRYPAQLSGGQQQRVGVARALAADPPVMLMDEPFSAVDPVVREQLQDEFLRLQGELGKTIVFVTHDIDEAIKLGDQVAVLRVGGTLAQLASPAELLSRPVDAFVAGFVGRDRGYRALGFTETSDLPVREEPTVTVGAPVPQGDERVLVVDDDAKPQGWVQRRYDGHRLPGDPAARRHAGHPGRQSPCGPRRLPLLALGARGRGRRRRPPARHGHGPRGAGPDREAGERDVNLLLAVPLPLDNSASSSPWHFWGYFLDHRSTVLGWLWDHAWLSVLPVVVGLLLALPLGWLARRYTWVYPPMMSITGLLYTVPSIALFVIIPPLFGFSDPLTPWQVPIALTFYSTALLVRVVADGLGAVSSGDRAGRDRDRLPAAGPVLPRRAADRRPGDHRRAPGRDRGQRQPGRGGRHDRPGQPRPALRRGLQAVDGHAVLPADRARASCCACCWRWCSTPSSR